MPQVRTNDFDFLAAKLHARRARLADGPRLDALLRETDAAAFAQALQPPLQAARPIDMQRLLVQNLVAEMDELRGQLAGSEAALLEWMLARFQVENLKLIVRGRVEHVSLDEIQAHLIGLPPRLSMDTAPLLDASSPEEAARHAPRGLLAAALARAPAAGERSGIDPFEHALDHAYFEELLIRLSDLPEDERDACGAVVRQEADIFHLMLVARAHFNHGQPPEALLPFHVRGTRLSRARFAVMLGAVDLAAAAAEANGLVLDEAPPAIDDPASADAAAAVEARGWNRFARLASGAFQRGDLGFAVVVGYVALRRLEVARLITLTEGFLRGVDTDARRRRAAEPGGAHA